MRRRDFLVGSGVVLGGVNAVPARAFVQEKDGKTLVFSGNQPVPVLDPHAKYDYSTRMMQQAVYDAMAKYVDNPAKIIPWLAEKWETSPDQLIWTFHLVKGAKFHNGDPVDAEAVRYSFERGLKLNKGVAWMLKEHLAPDDITVVDEHVVQMKLARPFPGFITFVPWWFIVNPKQVKAHEVNGDLGQQWMTANEAGSGPFAIKSWNGQSVMDLAAVPDYWRGWPQPKGDRLAGVIYRVIREPAPRRAALERGEVDMVTDLTPEDYDQLTRAKGIKVSTNPGMTPFTIMLNTQHGPTADVNFRKALAYAFDYTALLQIENGAARLLDSPFPDGLIGHVKLDMPRQNLDLAKQYLAKTPWKDGGVTIDYAFVSGLEVERQIGLAALESFQKLNIKVNVEAMPWPTLVARGSKAATGPAMIAVYVTPISTDPDVVAAQYTSAASGSYWGMHHLNDPELDAMVAKARLETDKTARLALYAAIQQRILADQPAIFGMMEDRRWAMQDAVKGFVFCPVRLTGEVDFYPMYIAAG